MTLPRGWARSGDPLCDALLAEDVSCALRATYRHKWHTDGRAEWTDPPISAAPGSDVPTGGGGPDEEVEDMRGTNWQ